MALTQEMVARFFDPATRVAGTSYVAPLPTAVADTAVADQPFTQSDTSIAGDTASETDDGTRDPEFALALRQQKRAPLEPVHGSSSWRRPSRHNSNREVGNFGLLFGNWGQRGTLGGRGAQAHRRIISDRQILKSPGQVVIVAEASAELGDLLRQPEEAGSSAHTGLQKRNCKEYFVVRGSEPSALLVASRKDNTESLACLKYDVHDDHDYVERKKRKTEVEDYCVQRWLQTERWPSWQRDRGRRSAWALPHHEDGMARTMESFLGSTRGACATIWHSVLGWRLQYVFYRGS